MKAKQFNYKVTKTKEEFLEKVRENYEEEINFGEVALKTRRIISADLKINALAEGHGTNNDDAKNNVLYHGENVSRRIEYSASINAIDLTNVKDDEDLYGQNAYNKANPNYFSDVSNEISNILRSVRKVNYEEIDETEVTNSDIIERFKAEMKSKVRVHFNDDMDSDFDLASVDNITDCKYKIEDIEVYNMPYYEVTFTLEDGSDCMAVGYACGHEPVVTGFKGVGMFLNKEEMEEEYKEKMAEYALMDEKIKEDSLNLGKIGELKRTSLLMGSTCKGASQYKDIFVAMDDYLRICEAKKEIKDKYKLKAIDESLDTALYNIKEQIADSILITDDQKTVETKLAKLEIFNETVGGLDEDIKAIKEKYAKRVKNTKKDKLKKIILYTVLGVVLVGIVVVAVVLGAK